MFNFSKLQSIVLFFILFFIAGCSSSKSVDSMGPLHRPYYNPGGIDFEKDKEFYKSYQKLSRARKRNCEVNQPVRHDEEDIVVHQNGLFPGSILISTQNSSVMGKKDLNWVASKIKNKNDSVWFQENCVENKELSDEIKELIVEKCSVIFDKIEKSEGVKVEDLSCDLNFIKKNEGYDIKTTQNNCDLPDKKNNFEVLNLDKEIAKKDLDNKSQTVKIVDYEDLPKESLGCEVPQNTNPKNAKLSKPKVVKKNKKNIIKRISYTNKCKKGGDYEVLTIDNILKNSNVNSDCDSKIKNHKHNNINYINKNDEIINAEPTKEKFSIFKKQKLKKFKEDDHLKVKNLSDL